MHTIWEAVFPHILLLFGTHAHSQPANGEARIDLSITRQQFVTNEELHIVYKSSIAKASYTTGSVILTELGGICS